MRTERARQIGRERGTAPSAERWAISTCAACGVERMDPVPLAGEPSGSWWYGCCAVCQELRWFCLLRFVTLDAGAPASKPH